MSCLSPHGRGSAMNDLFHQFEASEALPKKKELRPHQQKAVNLLRQSLLAGKSRPILQCPTGGGKTLIAANIINSALDKGNTVAFCVPAISLIDQTVEAFRSEGIHGIGVIQASHPLEDYSQPVQVCSIQSLEKRVLPEMGLVIVDEAHQQRKVIYRWMERDAKTKFIGLSATPWSRGLGKYYDDLVIAATTRELIEAGYLSEYAVYAPTSPDLSCVKIAAGDYQQDQLSAVMQDHKLVGDIVQSWLELGNDDPTLCFAVDRAHAKSIQKQFAAHGIAFGYCDANTDLVERRLLFQQMARREIKGIVNVGTLTTGVDADVRTLILARPTKSPALFVQIVGRALRTAPGKEIATIIDHSDTTLSLGMPCRITRNSLSTGERIEQKGSKESEPKKPKACPKCKTVKEPGVHECPNCGFAPELIRDVEAAKGKLVALDGSAKPKHTREEKQLWWSAIQTIRRERGRASGWAAHTYKEKFGVWPRGLDDTPGPVGQEVRNFVKAKDIRFAKRRAAQ